MFDDAIETFLERCFEALGLGRRTLTQPLDSFLDVDARFGRNSEVHFLPNNSVLISSHGRAVDRSR
jgi:hypothetical protein